MGGDGEDVSTREQQIPQTTHTSVLMLLGLSVIIITVMISLIFFPQTRSGSGVSEGRKVEKNRRKSIVMFFQRAYICITALISSSRKKKNLFLFYSTMDLKQEDTLPPTVQGRYYTVAIARSV